MDGEATECRLCKHCGCMLNTDYIRLRLITSDCVSQVAQRNLTSSTVYPPHMNAIVVLAQS